jgi:hypothetical protein
MMNTKDRDAFTTRTLLTLVTSQVETEARVAANGAIIRALAAPHGVWVPTPEEAEGL